MTETIDFRKIRKELIQIYEEFLKNPKDSVIISKIISYDRKYGGLSTYNSYLKSQPIPEDIEEGLGKLSTICQYGTWEENHDLSDKKILEEAKKILEQLKSAEED